MTWEEIYESAMLEKKQNALDFINTANDDQISMVDEFLGVLEHNGDSGSVYAILGAVCGWVGTDYVQDCLETIIRSKESQSSSLMDKEQPSNA